MSGTVTKTLRKAAWKRCDYIEKNFNKTFKALKREWNNTPRNERRLKGFE